MKIDSDIKKIFLFGLFIRFLFMPFTGFLQDVGNINYVSHIFATGNFNIYRYVGERLASGEILTIAGHGIYTIEDIWGYLPLGFIILGAFHWLFLPLLPGFPGENWLESYYVYRAVFLAQIPYLIFDIAIAWLIYRYFKDKDKDDVSNSSVQGDRAGLAFKLWWLNPVVIFASYIFGQIDVLLTFFAFAGAYIADRYKKHYSGSLLLGLGGLIKSTSMFLLPFLAFSPDVKGRKKLIAFMIGIGTVIIGILPFIGYEPFRSQILFTRHSSQLFALNFTPWASKDTTYIFVLAYVLLFLWYVIGDKAKRLSLMEVSLTLFSILFFSISMHPQWLLWLMPFLVVVSIERGYTRLLKYFYLFFFLAMLQWKFEWWYFELIAPDFFSSLPPIMDIIERVYKSQHLINIARSIFSAMLIFFILITLMGKKSADTEREIKISLGLRPKILLIVIMVIGIVAMFIPVKLKVAIVEQPEFSYLVGIDAAPVTQTFVFEGEKLHKVMIQLKVEKADPEERYDISVDLFEKGGSFISTKIIKTTELTGDRWVEVPFEGTILKEGGEYMLRIYSSVPVAKPNVFLKQSRDDAYEKGEMTHKGKSLTGDIAFGVVKRDKITIYEEFSERLLRDKPFLFIYAIIMAAMFVVILK